VDRPPRLRCHADRQIEAKALEKLRHPALARKLAAFLED
jgi:DNA-directed RNA polymerase sigma subunit (sigma70/sigma32)